MLKLRQILICCLLMLTAGSVFAKQLNHVRVWAGPENTRVVLDLSADAQYSYFVLDEPPRLVLDLKEVNNKVDLNSVTATGSIVNKVRSSTPPSKGSSRLVLELSQTVEPVVFPLKPNQNQGHRIVIDLPDHQGQVQQTRKQQSTVKEKTTKSLTGDRDIIIAIDAGHGGEDPGAIGPNNIYEKHVTLAIAKRLNDMVNAEPGFKGVLIRTGDYHINLDKRSRLAREYRADFLVSIHADGFRTPQPRGASVLILNPKRGSFEVKQHQNEQGLLGGIAEVIENTQSDANLKYALIDLQMSYSTETASFVADRVIKELSRVAHMHKTVANERSLAVLKAPDIPSILVEAGFITNPGEAKLLRSGNHQHKIARAVYRGIQQHYQENPPIGTLYAKRFSQKEHTVKRGDSLSKVASLYSVSVSSLKKANNLNSSTIKIGQVLRIPNS